MTNRWFLGSLSLLAAVLSGTLLVWANREEWLPDNVPVHWGISGKPDRFVERGEMLPMLLVLPGLMLGLILLGRFLPWLSPGQFAIDTFRDTYERIMFLVVLLLGYIGVVALLAQTGRIEHLDRWLVGGILILLGALGNLFGKVRRNFYVGVRTPWTLASDTVWERTHRLAAWTTVAGSAVGLVMLLTPLHALFALAPALLGLLGPVFYSLWLYKRLEAQGKLESQRQPALVSEAEKHSQQI